MEQLQTQGISLPRLGLGTYRMQGDACLAAVESALALGYRHIDTAEMYGNEEAIGAAIAASKVARKDLHVTTKVWNENLAPDAMRRAFDASLKKLRLDHVDLYLVHWPAPNMNVPAMFETLMKLKQEGRTRAIGVANFNVALLKKAVEEIADCLQSGRVSCDARSDELTQIYGGQIDPAGGLLPARARQGSLQRDVDRNRQQAWRECRASRAEMVARSGRRGGDSEGFAQGKPAG